MGVGRFAGGAVQAEDVVAGPGEVGSVLHVHHDHTLGRPPRQSGELVQHVQGKLLKVFKLLAVTATSEVIQRETHSTHSSRNSMV